MTGVIWNSPARRQIAYAPIRASCRWPPLHAYFEEVPDVVLGSLEADFLIPEDAPPETARKIQLRFGRNSVFNDEHGYYADVAVYGLALLPPDWGHRLKCQSLAGNTLSLCSLEPHDLANGKLYADRPKDIEFLADALEMRIVTYPLLAERINEFGDDLQKRALLGARLQLLRSKISDLRLEQAEQPG